MKRGQVNEFETYIPIEMDLDKFFLEEGTNKVLVKVFKDDVKTSVGGLITTGLDHYNFAKNTERRGEVIKTVDKIFPGQNGIETMMHNTDVEIQVGDIVYFNYLDNINSFIYQYKDEIYKLIPYSAIILTIRDDKTTMCNGYVLIEEVPEKREGVIHISEELIPKNDVVKYTGSLNKKYFLVIQYGDIEKFLMDNPDKDIYAWGDSYVLVNHPDRTDYGTRDLKEGDRVVIGDARWKFPLEEYAYARFDNRKVYYVVPRHCIIGIMHPN